MRLLAAKALRNGMQFLIPVDLFVGQGVENVESAGPEEDHQAQQGRSDRQVSRHGNIGARGRDAERSTHAEMAEPGKAF